MNTNELAAATRFARAKAYDLVEQIIDANDFIHAAAMFSSRIERKEEREAFDRVVGEVQIAIGTLEHGLDEIYIATDPARLRAPTAWALKQATCTGKRPVDIIEGPRGDLVVVYLLDDGTRTQRVYRLEHQTEGDQ